MKLHFNNICPPPLFINLSDFTREVLMYEVVLLATLTGAQDFRGIAF